MLMDIKRPVVCWFRRDLRVEDNPALYHASAAGRPVIPLFVVDDDLVSQMPSDGAIFDFQAECLHDLSASLEKLGGRLIVRKGKLRDVFAKVIDETNPQAVYFNRDYEPSALDRDRATSEILQSAGIKVNSFDDVVIHSPEGIRTVEGEPYVVFTPYAAKWQSLAKAAPLGKPSRLEMPIMASEPIPGARELGRKTTIFDRVARGGESRAKERWGLFLREMLPEYDSSRDFPSLRGTSMMSPYLRFGCISPVKMYADLRAVWYDADKAEKESIDKYVIELIWREFYMSVLYHYPFTVGRNYRRAFDRFKWHSGDEQFEAWKEGRTGFPLVDAGMRELNYTGWMHNRVRMVVASFLTKDLFIDWRRGEEYFATKLLDIEKASNVGGWQWSASTGVDPRPLRIFNPTLQSRRFDGEGEYIKKWVPELKYVPSKHIHEPARMSPTMQRDLGVTIGKEYPAPIVDHREAAAAFARKYIAAKSEQQKTPREPKGRNSSTHRPHSPNG